MKLHSLPQAQRRVPRVPDRALDFAMRVIPVAALVAVGALFAAQQAVRPSHRAIKALVLLALMALMFRFDMVYSVYLFALLFPFPSGISGGSSNNVLMTVIPMIWAVRATSGKIPLMRRTALDVAIAAFLIAHLVSLIGVGEEQALARGFHVLWQQLTACAFFYTIVLFVNDEAKLFRLGKIMCVACFLVMSTAVTELFFPGRVLIPGWIGLTRRMGEGLLKHRIEGLRVGGAFESHDMVGDFGTQLLLFMVFYFLRARNPAEKAFWFLTVGTTVIAVMATANRGAVSGLILGVVLALIYFRRVIGAARMVLLIAVGTAVIVTTDSILSERTIAVSVIDRFANTQFEGIVPENRTMTWKPSIDKAMERPLFGHGPYYDTGIGLTKRYWPHNGYLFYFVTLGIFGMVCFLWVMWGIYRESRWWRHPSVRGSDLGNFLALAQIWFLVMAWEQLRTDHQRDDIYPYIVWMCFGVVVAAAALVRTRAAVPAAVVPGTPAGRNGPGRAPGTTARP
jgi:O-antigen ligase